MTKLVLAMTVFASAMRTCNTTNLARKSGQYALVNLTYYPVQALMTALELQYGRRRNFSDGWEYDAWRIQFSAKYPFSFRLGDKP